MNFVLIPRVACRGDRSTDTTVLAASTVLWYGAACACTYAVVYKSTVLDKTVNDYRLRQ